MLACDMCESESVSVCDCHCPLNHLCCGAFFWRYSVLFSNIASSHQFSHMEHEFVSKPSIVGKAFS